MKIKQAHIVAYSPTGTTHQNLKSIAKGMGFASPIVTDITLPSCAESVTVRNGSLALIGAPVYGGRVAPTAVSRLKAIKGQGAPAVVVAVYGNRAYENALIELKHLAEEAGFTVIGAAAMLGRHSFSSEGKPIAHARPDAIDAEKAEQFGHEVMEKLEAEGTAQVAVPGELPEEPFEGRRGASPDVNASLCGGCGTCVSVCPLGLISLVDDVASIDNSVCSFCCACVQNCPNDALSVSFEPIVKATEWLYSNCQERREPEFYL